MQSGIDASFISCANVSLVVLALSDSSWLRVCSASVLLLIARLIASLVAALLNTDEAACTGAGAGSTSAGITGLACVAGSNDKLVREVEAGVRVIGEIGDAFFGFRLAIAASVAIAAGVCALSCSSAANLTCIRGDSLVLRKRSMRGHTHSSSASNSACNSNTHATPSAAWLTRGGGKRMLEA